MRRPFPIEAEFLKERVGVEGADTDATAPSDNRRLLDISRVGNPNVCVRTDVCTVGVDEQSLSGVLRRPVVEMDSPKRVLVRSKRKQRLSRTTAARAVDVQVDFPYDLTFLDNLCRTAKPAIQQRCCMEGCNCQVRTDRCR